MYLLQLCTLSSTQTNTFSDVYPLLHGLILPVEKCFSNSLLTHSSLSDNRGKVLINDQCL